MTNFQTSLTNMINFYTDINKDFNFESLVDLVNDVACNSGGFKKMFNDQSVCRKMKNCSPEIKMLKDEIKIFSKLWHSNVKQNCSKL